MATQPQGFPGEMPSADQTLVVLLHAYTLTARSLAALKERIRGLEGYRTEKEARFFVPELPLSLLSLADPSVIVVGLIDDIDRIVSESGGRIGRIQLIGHSYGALLARKLYIAHALDSTRARSSRPR
jgi:pimeloyl-ACP methyl ester carboxylesterase